jgi:6-phosphogluconolactonase
MAATIPTQLLRWHPEPSLFALISDARSRLLDSAARAIDERGRFVVVLAGGNTPRGLYEQMRDVKTDWSCWHVWFGDERCAAPDDPERNSRMAQAAWLDRVAIPAAQVHAIAAERGAVEAARRYVAELAGVGTFDMVLLGLGEDGHTGSLFPGHDAGRGADAASALAVFGAPKAPQERVSLSARRFSDARETIFLVNGESKRNAVQRWRRGEPIPASMIVPPGGVDVLVDASLLA